jgi:hypothetical protein
MNESGLCKCGCGQITSVATRSRNKMRTNTESKLVKGLHLDYVVGHNINSFTNGISHTSLGYVLIKMPDHPRSRSNGFVLEHIVVAEKKYGRFINKPEVVHHIDENPKNNNPDNLMLFANNTEHKNFHMQERAFAETGNRDYRRCVFCKQYDSPENLIFMPDKTAMLHIKCRSEYDRQRRLKKLMNKEAVPLQSTFLNRSPL